MSAKPFYCLLKSFLLQPRPVVLAGSKVDVPQGPAEAMVCMCACVWGRARVHACAHGWGGVWKEILEIKFWEEWTQALA